MSAASHDVKNNLEQQNKAQQDKEQQDKAQQDKAIPAAKQPVDSSEQFPKVDLRLPAATISKLFNGISEILFDHVATAEILDLLNAEKRAAAQNSIILAALIYSAREGRVGIAKWLYSSYPLARKYIDCSFTLKAEDSRKQGSRILYIDSHTVYSPTAENAANGNNVANANGNAANNVRKQHVFPNTLLGIASFYGRYEMVLFLTNEMGANINACSSYGYTPLHETYFGIRYKTSSCGTEEDYCNIATFLVSRGAAFTKLYALRAIKENRSSVEKEELARERLFLEIECCNPVSKKKIDEAIDEVFRIHSNSVAPYKSIISDYLHWNPHVNVNTPLHAQLYQYQGSVTRKTDKMVAAIFPNPTKSRSACATFTGTLSAIGIGGLYYSRYLLANWYKEVCESSWWSEWLGPEWSDRLWGRSCEKQVDIVVGATLVASAVASAAAVLFCFDARNKSRKDENAIKEAIKNKPK